MTWLMWEARSAPGQQAALLSWAVDQASPQAQVYASEDRVVIIAEETGTSLPDPPNALLARPPHAWSFERAR